MAQGKTTLAYGSNMNIKANVAELIGGTPLVYMNKIAENSCARIAAKLEFLNPGFSVKDRIALNMLLEAEKAGQIIPGKTILVEATSGNTGIGLAVLAAQRGYKILLIMPHKCSVERRITLLQLGAKLILTDAATGFQGVIDKLEEVMSKLPNSFALRQFENEANPAAHVLTTGPEIWKDTDGKIDMFVANVGTGGTITGTGRFLKNKNPEIKVIVVEPEESAVISGGKPGPHKIQGTGAGIIPDTLDLKVVDEIVKVHSDDAIDFARKIAEIEGLLVGISSGAALKAAIEVGKRKENEGKLIVVIFPSGGERYISTELFDKAREEALAMEINQNFEVEMYFSDV